MIRQFVCIALISFLLTTTAVGQEPQQSPDEVLRITTELVQTGVIVVDKQGRFVEGLIPNRMSVSVAVHVAIIG